MRRTALSDYERVSVNKSFLLKGPPLIIKNMTPEKANENHIRTGWRSLQQRRADARLCLFFKIVNNMVAVSLPDYIQPNPRTSRRGHYRSFCQLHTGKDYYKYSFFPLAIVQWNALPEDVVSSPNLDIGQVGMTSLQVNCSLTEVNASVFIAVF